MKSGSSLFSAGLILIFLSALVSQAVFAFTPPPLSGPVVDQAQILNESDRRFLETQIQRLYQKGRAQAQILTLNSLEGETIEQVSIAVTDQWKLGTKDGDNGVLIIVAPNEKKVRIEVGQGLEGDIPDLLAHQIIQQKIIPEFKTGDYGKGLIAAMGAITVLLDPHTAQAAKNIRSETPPVDTAKGILYLILFGFVFLVIFTLLFGFSATGDLLMAILLSGGRGGRRGGGWSGGGGGFSGGGASGGW